MLPRYHILLGAIVSAILYFASSQIGITEAVIIFLASFLIDFDHYAASFLKSGHISLSKSFEYHRLKGIQEAKDIKQGIKRKGDFHLFHTVEFHLVVLVIGIFFWPFLYIFLGMLLHSLLDLVSLTYGRRMHRREFFLVNWLAKKYS